jgi:O-methyltransferase
MFSIRKRVRRLFNKLGYDIAPLSNLPAHADPEFPFDFDGATIDICRFVKPFTMTSVERIFSLCRSVEYIVQHNIPGDIVECGVWKGGSMMAIARTLANKGVIRKLHLFDTFEGMSEPTDADKNFRGQLAADALATEDKQTSQNWAYSPLEEVKNHLRETGYDQSQVVFVKGKVEDTIPGRAPAEISVLRLDTDWYESTYHELVHLYPRLSVGGVLIVDDYGHWEGARKAVDQYLAEKNLKLLLNRIDYTGRIGVKLEA